MVLELPMGIIIKCFVTLPPVTTYSSDMSFSLSGPHHRWYVNSPISRISENSNEASNKQAQNVLAGTKVPLTLTELELQFMMAFNPKPDRQTVYATLNIFYTWLLILLFDSIV